MMLFNLRRSLTPIVVLLVPGLASGQIHLTDQRTAPPSVPLEVDLAVPIHEVQTPGGWHFPASMRKTFGGNTPLEMTSSSKETPELRGFAPATRIRDVMTEPFVTTPGDGRVWIRTRDMRASFGPEGFVAYPIFGAQSPQEWPVHFEVDSVTSGGEALDSRVDRTPYATGGSVTIPRSDFDEVYHLALDEIEQTFVFDSLPTVGDLTVRMRVHTELQVEEQDGFIHFAHDTFGGLRYGSAFAVDGRGRRIEIERSWSGEGLELTVPSTFLATAALPLTIDPPIISWVNGFGADDDSSPDITFVGATDEYFICWQEFTSFTNADVYMTSVDQQGSQGTSLAIELTDDYWATPRLAYCAAGPRLLVAASTSADGPGTGSGAIRGQMVNPVTRALVSGQITISTVGSFKVNPDVGGTNRELATNSHFLVAWERINNATVNTIEYRAIDWTGSGITSVVVAANEANVRMRQPALSESHGDNTLNGDWWTLAWIRDAGTAGIGQVWARRVVWSGTPTFGGGNFRVGTANSCTNPSVTSQFDDTLLGTGQRPSIVAYERLFPLAPNNRNIEAIVVVDGAYYSTNRIDAQLEDFDASLRQSFPSVASDGKCFFLAYSEVDWENPTGPDLDMYMVSGHITTTGNDAVLALAERHQGMATTTSVEHEARVATVRDGFAGTGNDDAMCVWNRRITTNGGELRGMLLDCNTNGNSFERAVGQQYCDANANSLPYFGGRNSTWLWIAGTQSATDPHDAHCVEMPLNTFGYLNCSMTDGNFNMPAGSQGRLCLGGSIGRYVSQILSSGPLGRFRTTIDPQALPQPTGPVAAAPGETWYFQVWHRDSVGGQATSNFSNACAVYFLP